MGGRSSNSSRYGCGDVGGVLKSSMGWSFGEDGDDADFSNCDGAGAGGGVVATGVMVGGGVFMTTCEGVGVDKVRKFSLAMGEEMISGDDSSEDELWMLMKQQGFTLIRAVRFSGLDVEELFDFVIETF